MARPSICFFIFLHIALTIVVVHPRSLTTTKTTVLDVKASLQVTKTAFSYKPKTFHEQQENFENYPSSHTMQLHPREGLHKPTHSNYKSLTLSRLTRDSARVNSLTTRLSLALKNIKHSDLLSFNTESLQTPIISGTSQGSGEYFSRISIGNPPTSVYMVLDTGSDVNWLQCAPCAQCYQQADPVFEPASSSSYKTLTCEAKQCKSLDISECRNNTCLYEVSYGDGSYTVGDFVTETITLGSARVDNVAIGCGHNNEGLFIGAAGLLGLGGGLLSFPSQLNATSFSYCLVDRDSDSASTLEFNSPMVTNAVTAPLLRNPQFETFFYVDLTGVSVGGAMLPVAAASFRLDESGNGGVIVDSGTAVTRLESEVYKALRDSFVRGTRHLKKTEGVALFDTCYDLSSKDNVDVPTVSFHFPEGRVLPLAAKNYLIPVDSEGTFCLAFAPTSSLSIIGNVQQQGTRVWFDLRNSRIGFSPNQC